MAEPFGCIMCNIMHAPHTISHINFDSIKASRMLQCAARDIETQYWDTACIKLMRQLNAQCGGVAELSEQAIFHFLVNICNIVTLYLPL